MPRLPPVTTVTGRAGIGASRERGRGVRRGCAAGPAGRAPARRRLTPRYSLDQRKSPTGQWAGRPEPPERSRTLSTLRVTVEELTVHGHPNADALELAQVGLYRAVVAKGAYRTGDFALY